VRQSGDNSINDGLNFTFGETVKEKVRYHKIEFASTRMEAFIVYICLCDRNAISCPNFTYLRLQECQHPGTNVDGLEIEFLILNRQPRKESPISVAKDQSTFPIGNARDVREPDTLQQSAECAVLKPSIWLCYGIEVRGPPFVRLS